MDDENINPWLSIWVRPRIAIRAVVKKEPGYRFWLLAGLYGLIALLGFAQSFSVGYSMGLFPLLLIAILLAPLWGYAIFSLISWIVCQSGKWIGGKGNFREVRAAFAWSSVPMVVNLLLWIVMLGMFGIALFRGFPGNYAMGPAVIITLFAILLLQVVISIWRLVIYLYALAEVQGFSVAMSILNVIITGLLFAALSFCLFLLFFYLMGAA